MVSKYCFSDPITNIFHPRGNMRKVSRSYMRVRLEKVNISTGLDFRGASIRTSQVFSVQILNSWTPSIISKHYIFPKFDPYKMWIQQELT